MSLGPIRSPLVLTRVRIHGTLCFRHAVILPLSDKAHDLRVVAQKHILVCPRSASRRIACCRGTSAVGVAPLHAPSGATLSGNCRLLRRRKLGRVFEAGLTMVGIRCLRKVQLDRDAQQTCWRRQLDGCQERRHTDARRLRPRHSLRSVKSAHELATTCCQARCLQRCCAAHLPQVGSAQRSHQ